MGERLGEGVTGNARNPLTQPLPISGERSLDAPYTTALLLKLSAAMADVYNSNTPLGLERTRRIADILRTHGIVLVEPERQRCWIDERVYGGALFRLRLAETPPSLTLPRDLLPGLDRLVHLTPATNPDPAPPAPRPPDPADPGPIPSFLDKRRLSSPSLRADARGEVSASYADGGVIGPSPVSPDPSVVDYDDTSPAKALVTAPSPGRRA